MSEYSASGVSTELQAIEWVADQYDLARTSLEALGLGRERSIPTKEAIVETLTSENLMPWLSYRKEDDQQDELFIAPSVQWVGVKGLLRRGIVPRFDRQQPKGYGSFLQRTSGFWRDYGNKHPKHDNGRMGKWQVGVYLGDTHTSRFVASEPLAPGLIPAQHDIQSLRNHLGAEKLYSRFEGRIIDPLTIGQYVTLAAQHRLNARDMFDTETGTVLAHYSEQSWLERTVSGRNKLTLPTSYDPPSQNDAYDAVLIDYQRGSLQIDIRPFYRDQNVIRENEGVRRSLRIPLL